MPRKQNHQQKIFLVGATTLIVLVLAGAATLLGVSARKALLAQQYAEEVAAQALSRHLSTKAILAAKAPSSVDGFIDFAALLAVQSVKIKKDSESLSAALRVLQTFPNLEATIAWA